MTTSASPCNECRGEHLPATENPVQGVRGVTICPHQHIRTCKECRVRTTRGGPEDDEATEDDEPTEAGALALVSTVFWHFCGGNDTGRRRSAKRLCSQCPGPRWCPETRRRGCRLRSRSTPRYCRSWPAKFAAVPRCCRSSSARAGRQSEQQRAESPVHRRLGPLSQ